jgi:hypothetical protein
VNEQAEVGRDESRPVWAGYCVECDKDVFLDQMQAKHPEITEVNFKDNYDCPFCDAILIPF